MYTGRRRDDIVETSTLHTIVADTRYYYLDWGGMYTRLNGDPDCWHSTRYDSG